MGTKKFEAWLEKVNAICIDKLSAPVDCLPDWNWMEAYDDGCSPREAFDAFHEDQYGDDWDTINGQFGVGA